MLTRFGQNFRKQQSVVQRCGNLTHSAAHAVGVVAVHNHFGVKIATFFGAFTDNVVERKLLSVRHGNAV